MNNTVSVVLLFVLLVGLVAACGSPAATQLPEDQEPARTAQPTATPQPEASAADVEALARELVDLLVEGEYARAVERFDEKMTEVLPPDKLQETWESLIAQVGPFQRQSGARTEERDGYRVVFVTSEFEQATLDAQVAFDEEERVAGLFFVPSQAAAQTQTEPVDYYVAPNYVQPEAFVERAIMVGSGDWLMPGTFTLPQGEGPFPTVLLVHGSGPQDRDESVGFNKPFRDLAWGLASQGIAVLRYDKRTMVHQDRVNAMLEELTVQEETVDDALAALSLLGKMKDVDHDRIFVLGYSLGGMLTPRIGEQSAEVAGLAEIAGLIVMAGTTRPLEDVYLEQVNYVFALDGELSDQEKATLEVIEAQIAQVKDPALSPETPASDLPLGIPANYWLDLRDYDSAGVASALALPMLILQGERDYQVTTEDYAGWQAALSARDDVEFVLYPSLNHQFVEGEGPSSPEEELTTPGHVAEVVINDIVRWIEGH